MLPGILFQSLWTSPPDNDNSYQLDINFFVAMSQWINLHRKARSTMKIQYNEQNTLCQIHVLAPTYEPFHTQRSRGRKTEISKSYLFADTFKINFCPKSKSGNFIWFYFLQMKYKFILVMIRLQEVFLRFTFLINILIVALP